MEIAFSYVKIYEFARVKVRCSPEIQYLGLAAIYFLVAWELRRNPIHTQEEIDEILGRLSRTAIDKILNPSPEAPKKKASKKKKK